MHRARDKIGGTDTHTHTHTDSWNYIWATVPTMMLVTLKFLEFLDSTVPMIQLVMTVSFSGFVPIFLRSQFTVFFTID